MNKSLSGSKSKENSPSVKGARQTTLFDMKFKSNSSASENKPERAVLGESNRKLPIDIPLLKVEDDCEIFELPKEKPKRSKSAARKENDEVKAKSPKRASPKPQGKGTEEDPLLKKMKIYNFFVRVPVDEVAAAKAKIFSESESIKQTKKEKEEQKLADEQKKMQAKRETEEMAVKRQLEAPYLLGKRVFDSPPGQHIQNHMFGDLACMVEFYNTFSAIYVSRSATHFKYVTKRDKVEFTKIKFDDLVKMLNEDLQTPQSRKYYCKLIESLLRILLKYESIYERYALFGADLIGSELDESNLQDLCRIIATLAFKEHHENEINDTDLLLPSEPDEKRHALLKELRLNRSNDWFTNLSVQSRLELLILFCEQMLYGENFLKQKENLEAKTETMRAGIKDLRAKLKEEFDFALTQRAYTSKNELKIPKEIEGDEKKKTAFLKLVQKIKDLESKLKSAEHNLNKFSRIEPLTIDTNGYLYWHFSCIDGIIMERRMASEDGSDHVKSEWYWFTTTDELDNLICLLNHEPDNLKLVNSLKRKYEKIFGLKCKLDQPKKDAKPKVDIGKMLTGGEADTAKKPEPAPADKDPADDDKKGKYLTIEPDADSEQAGEKQASSQFQTAVDKLLERLLHTLHRAALNEDEFAVKKYVTTESYFEGSKSFDEKFDFIKKLMIESFDAFANDGHLKEGILGEKAELWKKCVEESESLSNLSYLNFILTKQTNWQIINQKKKVKNTGEMDEEEAELRERRRMARDELAESRPYSLRTLKKVNYDADEQLKKMITDQDEEEEEEEAEDLDHGSDPPMSEQGDEEPEAEGSDSDYEDEVAKPQRRSLRNNKSSSPEEPTTRAGRRSQRAKSNKEAAAEEEDTTGRRRSARLTK